MGLTDLMQGGGSPQGAPQGQMPPGQAPQAGINPQAILQMFNRLVQQGMDPQQAVMMIAKQLGANPQAIAQILMQFAPQQPQGGPPQGGMPGMGP